MELNRALEQHIAVFGESGSGKTVMLSSFYGATQEPQYLQKSLFHVLPSDIGQGNRLHRNYLGMRNSARLPPPDRFAATSYSFSLKFKEGPDGNGLNARPFDALRLVWHDYPGEWFEEDVSGPEEAQRRIDTFKALLGSDVALLLVDGQRLLENAGEEERYLKSLFGNFRNALLTLKDDLLEEGRPLVNFPRIWIFALSKSDLLPDLNVFKFRDLLIERASDDIDEVRKVISGFVEGSNALSVGEDFVLFSSAKFDTGKIEVAERVGLDLVLPLAAVLPFERHARWAEAMHLPGKLAESLLRGAGSLAASLLGRARMSGPLGLLLNFVGPDVVQEAANMAEDKLKDINAQAVAKRDFITATLTGFRMDLLKGEEAETLLRSRR